MQEDLTIVIPAYKPDYLKATLSSICNQTEMNFNLIVCDDASPWDLKGIVDEFPFAQYIRFEDNLGGKDLVKHWERSVSYAKTEWVWLFSDDDIMDKNCVQLFYKTIQENAIVDVFHFDLNIIDENGQIIRVCPTYPEEISPSDFLLSLYTKKIDARMPEFIFRKSVLDVKGFVDFDLAWRSDNATVINIALEKNCIKTILGPRISWRASSRNISSFMKDSIAIRKDNATIAFFNWLNEPPRKNILKAISAKQLVKIMTNELLSMQHRCNMKKVWEMASKFDYIDSNKKKELFLFFSLKRWLGLFLYSFKLSK